MKNGLFEFEDCRPGSFHELDYKGKILVLSPEFLKGDQRSEKGQLWLAVEGAGCEAGNVKGTLHAIRLSDSQGKEWRRSCFYGAIHPNLLPEWAGKEVSFINAYGDGNRVETLVGYVTTADGQSGGEVPLADWREALGYIRMQMEYQSHIEIADAHTEYIVAALDIKKDRSTFSIKTLMKMTAELSAGTEQEPVTKSLKLKDLTHLGDMDNVYLVHDTADMGFVPAGYLADMGEQDRQEHAELLDARVSEIRPGAYGTEVVLADLSPESLRAYEQAAADGQFQVRDEQEHTQSMT